MPDIEDDDDAVVEENEKPPVTESPSSQVERFLCLLELN